MSKGLDSCIEKVTSDKVKVVSFDIFDTLLVRPMIAPVDLFRLVGAINGYDKQQFVTMRTTCEMEARRNRKYTNDDVTLDEIYYQFEQCFSVSREKVLQLKKTELKLEYDLSCRRESICRVFDEAKRAGKYIIVVSDMYLSENVLAEMLKKNGIDGYEKLYVSCEYMKSKGSGRLFQEVINDLDKLKISPDEIIHIGDNKHADYNQPIKMGMKSILIPKAIDCYKKNRWLNRTLGVNTHFDNSYLVGFLANTFFDDPFEEYDVKSVINGNLMNLGIIMASIFLAFTLWMVKDINRESADKLLLVYRDGYIPEIIINEMKKYISFPVQIDNIYLNRMIRYCFCCDDDNPLCSSDVPFSNQMTIREFIQNRLLVSSDEDVEYVMEILGKSGYCSLDDKIDDKRRIFRVERDLDIIIKKNFQTKKSIILRYCKEKIQKAKKIAIFDIGYRGSVARFLKKELNYQNVISYQLFATSLVNCAYKEVPINSYIRYGCYFQTNLSILHQIFEQVISIQEKSPIGMDEKNGNIVLKYSDNDENFDDNIEKMQKRIVDFCYTWLDVFKSNIAYMEFDPYNEFQLLQYMFGTPIKKDADAIRQLAFKDSVFISGKNDKNPYDRWYESHFGKFKVDNRNGLIINSLRSFFRKIHCYDKAQFVYYKLLTHYRNNKKKENFNLELRERDYRQFEKTYTRLKAFKKWVKEEVSVIIGDFISFDKGICSFVQNMINQHNELKWILMSEAIWLNDSRTSEKINAPFHIVPDLLGKKRYLENVDIVLDDEEKGILMEHDEIRKAAENYQKFFPKMTVSYAQYVMISGYKYYSGILEILKPKYIFLWNQFYAMHQVIEYIAYKMGITIKYMEFGSIPGTVAIEENGQMGESDIAKNSSYFISLPVSVQEVKAAKFVRTYLKKSRLNRNVQIADAESIEIFKKIKEKNKPIIFYAGQDDYESGMYPYTQRSREYHSPIFESSDEGVIFLAEIAKQNDWILLYKPHPQYHTSIKGNYKNLCIINGGDINDCIDIADITVTILSSTAYLALIRGKAVVMLGYNQLKGKQCTYEAFIREEIEDIIRKALQDGMTKGMEEYFEKHIAQLLKYSLFDDGLPREIRYGQKIDKLRLEGR